MAIRIHPTADVSEKAKIGTEPASGTTPRYANVPPSEAIASWEKVSISTMMSQLGVMSRYKITSPSIME